jgi:hypothetical protein
MKQVQLSLETAKEMYFNGSQALKQFALENYSKEELEKKQLPKTWEELKEYDGYFVDDYSNITTTSSNNPIISKNVFKTEEQAKASIALAQLSQLIHVYNDGWVPDWSENNFTSKYVIEIYENKPVTTTYAVTQRFLAFKTPEIRDEFLKNFESLILEAKPLL